MSSPFAEELAQLRTELAALTPTVESTIPFVAVAGDLPAAEEPAIRTRAFEVVADGGAGVTQAMMAPQSRQAKRKFAITVLYDSDHDIPALDAMIAADDDLIIATAEQPPYAAGVQFVACAGGKQVKSGDFWRRTLLFDCLYVSEI